MRISLVSLTVLAGVAVASAPAALAAPVGAGMMRAGGHGHDPSVTEVYYYQGRYYPYRYRGQYYPYRYHGQYYRYYWNHRYYNHRDWHGGRWHYY